MPLKIRNAAISSVFLVLLASCGGGEPKTNESDADGGDRPTATPIEHEEGRIPVDRGQPVWMLPLDAGNKFEWTGEEVKTETQINGMVFFNSGEMKVGFDVINTDSKDIAVLVPFVGQANQEDGEFLGFYGSSAGMIARNDESFPILVEPGESLTLNVSFLLPEDDITEIETLSFGYSVASGEGGGVERVLIDVKL